MNPLHLAMHKALGGEYHLSDGRVFWMDRLAVDEIVKRLERFEFRERQPDPGGADGGAKV